MRIINFYILPEFIHFHEIFFLVFILLIWFSFLIMQFLYFTRLTNFIVWRSTISKLPLFFWFHFFPSSYSNFTATGSARSGWLPLQQYGGNLACPNFWFDSSWFDLEYILFYLRPLLIFILFFIFQFNTKIQVCLFIFFPKTFRVRDDLEILENIPS